jgi:hypothetical protein
MKAVLLLGVFLLSTNGLLAEKCVGILMPWPGAKPQPYTLDDADCAAWQAVYDEAGGKDWTICREAKYRTGIKRQCNRDCLLI